MQELNNNWLVSSLGSFHSFWNIGILNYIFFSVTLMVIFVFAGLYEDVSRQFCNAKTLTYTWPTSACLRWMWQGKNLWNYFFNALQSSPSLFLLGLVWLLVFSFLVNYSFKVSLDMKTQVILGILKMDFTKPLCSVVSF